MAVQLVLSFAAGMLLFWYRREIQDAIERFKDNFRGGSGPRSPMHPSPAADAFLLGRKRFRKAVRFGLLGMVMAVYAAPTPQQADLWRALREGLTGPESEDYWKQMHNAKLPLLAGTVVRVLENEGVSKVMVAMTNTTTPEVQLVVFNGTRKLRRPLVGTEVQFEGIAIDFTKDPFLLTFEVDTSRGILANSE